jgi:uncharacterized membrane protein HdeD (DUF308 family)
MTIDTKSYVKQLTRNWWLLLVRGFLLVIFGFYALLRPTTDTALITVLVGVFLLLNGVAMLIVWFFGRNDSPDSRHLLVRSVLSLVAGGVVVVAPLLARTVAVYVAATGLIVVGGMDLFNGLRRRNSADAAGSNIAASLLLILVGIGIALLPTFASEAVIRIIGFCAVPVGLYMLIYAGRIRRAIKALDAVS